MKLDLTKPMQTDDGLQARFLGRINDEDFPLAFAISAEDGNESVTSYAENGVSKVYYYPRIINVPIKTVVYLIFYKYANNTLCLDSVIYDDKKRAECVLEDYLKTDSNYFIQELEITIPELSCNAKN